MELKLKSTEETKWSVEDEFIENLQEEFKIVKAIKIASFIQNNLQEIPKNPLTSQILGGCVVDIDKKNITFALEIIRLNKGPAILSDICLISMDEYLDLRLLNCYIKNPNELG
jgi:hypothetical protein|tara:strand:- start:1101 stop:1439 length:339 start_codon:yes stop_codon:yes gene_type:complete